MASEGNLEIEVKIAAPDLAAVQSRLVALGFSMITPRTFESNTVWDTAARAFRQSGEIIRLREFGDRRVLTYKGPAVAGGKHKQREELESELTSLTAMERVLARVGLEPAFRYEKYRSEFQRPGESGVVTLDETPIGHFIELEGAAGWIDRTAAALGFPEREYVTKSYATLYVEHCVANGVEPSHMVF